MNTSSDCLKCLLFCAFVINGLVSCLAQTCDPEQFLELGKTGKLKCSFPERFLLVWWYNATQITNDPPIIKYKNFVKSGYGYTSGEFDVDASGVLIINNVTLQHEHYFSAAYIPLNAEEPVIIEVLVFAIVKPVIPYPHIRNCKDNSRICFLTEEPTLLICEINDIRPSASLSWKVRTSEGDKNVSSQVTTSQRDTCYSTNVTTNNIFMYSSILSLLVCHTNSPPALIENFESLILVQNKAVDVSLIEPVQKYIELRDELELSCKNREVSFLAWFKIESLKFPSYQTLGFAIFERESFKQVYSDDYSLDQTGSLVISTVRGQHGGLYGCSSGNGTGDYLVVYNVIVYEHPNPAYPSITGCSHASYCVLETIQEGCLTCSVKGIFPQVQLEWRTFYGSDANLISFTNQQLTIKDNGESVDVSLTANYHIRDDAPNRLTIECKVSELNSIFGYLSTKMDLLLIKDSLTQTEKNVYSTALLTTPAATGLFWVIPVVVMFIFLLVLCLAFFIRRHIVKSRKPIPTNQQNPEEVIRMMDPNEILKDQFLKQLRERYKDLYNAVQPIPYIKDRLYCVDKVFVEGGLQFLDTTGEAQWKSLESYEDLFSDPRIHSTRVILEGDPGYGKSTVTLQFAYDWSNLSSTSALKDVDIVILLRLRQLGGVSSIFTAIKQFLLPIDTQLSETDIENMLYSSSVVFIFDGFDEYPDQEGSETSDVFNIILRKKFQECKVILTTRSSVLPRFLPPQTIRIKLTGFDDKARRFYIRKAVVGSGKEEEVQKIEGYLQQNSILKDLCQVPLLFVIFAHMTHESEHFRKLVSVTSFFRYMVSSFHSHLRNKTEGQSNNLDKFETEHSNLDKIAFEAFSGKKQILSWGRESLIQIVGEEFYLHYLRIGILVEEEVVAFCDQPGAPTIGPVQYRKQVRFYHKLFCEWYAAHYLSFNIQNNLSVDLVEILRHLDPFDVQYVYRFACGLNSTTAEKIIAFLKNVEGGDKFAVLCILEQTGKIANIAGTIRQLCDESVLISGHDSMLLQRSSVQLLEIAARNEIPIRRVDLYNCFDSVDVDAKLIRTTSGLVLDARIPFVRLKIHVTSRHVTENEANDILKYAVMCSRLEFVTFSGCVPPWSFNDKNTLSSLRSKKITVRWRLTMDSPLYILSLDSGLWEDKHGTSQPTEAEFKNLKLKMQSSFSAVNNIEHRKNVRETRDRLRRKAEERGGKEKISSEAEIPK